MIKKIAVIGAGVMGSGIATLAAMNNLSVLLFDIVIDKSDPNSIANNAIKNMKKINTKLITACNLDSDLEKLKDVDWIIEVIKEDASTKKALYKKIEHCISKDAIISSNTSTIKRKDLITDMSPDLANRFFITHFFNPPQHMRLMEIVKKEDQHTNIALVEQLCDEVLGKTLVHCNDSPGFIGNRVGCFWLLAALVETNNFDVTIEEVDSMSNHRLIGTPKTGIFGLLDLIGIDTFVLICESLTKTLPVNDEFCILYASIPKIVKNMIHDGFVGLKSKGGFYKTLSNSDFKIKQSIDLSTGLYKNTIDVDMLYVKTLHELLTLNNKTAQYLKNVWIRTLNYTASLIPEVTNNVCLVDEVMRLGFNWVNGPFVLIDLLKTKQISGVQWLKDNITSTKIASILMNEKDIYIPNKHLCSNGEYENNKIDECSWYLYDKKHVKTPIICNTSGNLWDIGDGIVCFEITSKNNCFDYSVLKLLNDSVEIVKQNFTGMIIGNDGNNFSVGANLRLFFKKSPEYVKYIIDYGQQIFKKIKFAPFPVIAAVNGFTVGGGCEISLHCDGIVAHINTSMGLVEANIGVIPGWGGCKEMLLRYNGENTEKLFNQIFTAMLSSNAEDLKEMKIFREKDRIVRNKKGLLPEAKFMALEMAKNYVQLKPKTIKSQKINYQDKDFSMHDKVIAQSIYNVLINSNGQPEDFALKLEQEMFIYLINHPDTQARIRHMFYHKSKLHN